MSFKKIALTGLQLVIAILSMNAAAPFAFAQAKWEKLAPFPEPVSYTHLTLQTKRIV